mmetsp:Transcript_57825/g.154480  ORF Transcript_57825/g.154480 Transcript_57825/m.154480 type:complete len:229 (+) Transcript_57825:171-857(+)
MNTKAEKSDLMVVKEAVSDLTAEQRRKEGVLFGARCLSCNRVFEDFAEDNVVDLAHEKQKHTLLAHVQKQLNDPSSDYGKPVKLLSVRIGKAGRKEGKDGQMYQQRESKYGNAMEDMAFVLPPAGPPQTPGKGTSPGTSKSKSKPHKERASDKETRGALSRLVGRTPVASTMADSQMSYGASDRLYPSMEFSAALQQSTNSIVVDKSTNSSYLSARVQQALSDVISFR